MQLGDCKNTSHFGDKNTVFGQRTSSTMQYYRYRVLAMHLQI